MMDAVPTRRHDHRSEHAVERRRKLHVRVVEDNGRAEQPLPACEIARTYAERDDLRDAHRDRQHDLERVNPQCRVDVTIAIDVMDEMQAP